MIIPVSGCQYWRIDCIASSPRVHHPCNERREQANNRNRRRLAALAKPERHRFHIGSSLESQLPERRAILR